MAKTLQNGIDLLKQGDLEGSEQIFLEILKNNPGDTSARLWLGDCYVLVGDTSKAKATFIKLLGCEEKEIREEAARQLRALQYNRLMHFLLINPPLRWLLLFSVIGYGAGLGLRSANMKPMAAWVELVVVWGGLSLFFFWALFIVSFFVGNVAFLPQSKNNKAAKSAKIAFWLAGIFVIPANFLMSYGLFVKILAIFLDAFVLSIILSRGLSMMGQRLSGEAGESDISVFGFDSEAHTEAALANPPLSNQKSTKKKKKKGKKKIRK